MIQDFYSTSTEIQCLIFEEEQNKVTISGRFDPEKLKMKLYCKARNCITCCEIKIEIVPITEPPGEPDNHPGDPEPSPPPPLAITVNVNVIGIAFPPYVPKVCQSQRPCYEVICEDGICRPPSCVPMGCPKRCYGGCEEHEICSCSGYRSGSICSSPSFWK